MNEAENLVRALGGKWTGSGGTCFCPAHNNTRTPALSVSLSASGRLLLTCFAGCDFVDIIGACRARGLLPGGGHYTPPTPAENAKAKAEAEAYAAKVAGWVRGIWNEAQPIGDTLSERYLTRRGLTGPFPATLRHHDGCWHGPSAKRFPALIAAIAGSEGPAIHRTYLAPDGSSKADCEPNRMMLGKAGGGSVRLVAGDGPLMVAEGIETALSVAMMYAEKRPTLVAALSTSGVQSLRLPSKPGKLIACPDGDAPGRTASTKLCERATLSGWEAHTLDPGDGADFNDILQRRAAA